MVCKWELENDENGDAYAWAEPFDQWLIRDRDSDNLDIVAIVPKTGDEDYDNDVTYPNARLMASAPELLNACIAAENWCREYEVQNNGDEGAAALIEQLREAIANAVG